MKRKLTMLGVSALFLTVTSVVAYLTSFLPLSFGWVMGIGAILLGLGIVALVTLGKHSFTKCIVTATNAISMGFFLRGWYINRGFNNPFWLILLVVSMALLYYVIAVLPLLIPAVNAKRGLYLTLFVLVSIVIFVCLVIFTKTTWVSTLGYYGLIQIGFVICLTFDDDEKIYNAMLASTYTVAICAVIILIVALGADDLGGLFDGFGGGGEGRTSKAKSKKQSKDKL